MQLIKEWLGGFVASHRMAWPDADWPAADSGAGRRLWSEWLNALIAAKVTEPEARAASRLMGDVPYDLHPARLVGLVIAARERMAQQVVTSSREAAAAASRDCPYCDGEGICEVFDPHYDGRRVMERECWTADGKVMRRPFPMVVAAHCSCPMGRWIRGKMDTEQLRRIPDLVEVIAGRTRWVAADPNGDTPGPGLPVYHREKGGVIHAPSGIIEEE